MKKPWFVFDNTTITQTTNRKCHYNDGYGGCTHKSVIERTQKPQPPCKEEYCPLKLKKED